MSNEFNLEYKNELYNSSLQVSYYGIVAGDWMLYVREWDKSSGTRIWLSDEQLKDLCTRILDNIEVRDLKGND